jgi:hypothetical protein
LVCRAGLHPQLVDRVDRFVGAIEASADTLRVSQRRQLFRPCAVPKRSHVM